MKGVKTIGGAYDDDDNNSKKKKLNQLISRIELYKPRKKISKGRKEDNWDAIMNGREWVAERLKTKMSDDEWGELSCYN